MGGSSRVWSPPTTVPARTQIRRVSLPRDARGKNPYESSAPAVLVRGVSQQPFFVAAQPADVRVRVPFPRRLGPGPPRVTAKSRKTVCTRPSAARQLARDRYLPVSSTVGSTIGMPTSVNRSHSIELLIRASSVESMPNDGDRLTSSSHGFSLSSTRMSNPYSSVRHETHGRSDAIALWTAGNLTRLAFSRRNDHRNDTPGAAPSSRPCNSFRKRCRNLTRLSS